MAVIGHLNPDAPAGDVLLGGRPVAAATPTAADVSVVVPVGGPAAAWPRAASSLARLDPAPREIIAVIDGANARHAAAAAASGAKVVMLEERGGPARARNLGARTAAGAIVLFLDADIEAPRDLVERVAGVFAADTRLSAVMGSYDAAPGDPGLVSQYRNLLHHFIHQAARERASTFWTGCGAIRRQVFLDAGGFDERFVEPCIEDIELGMRLVREGHAIRLEKSLQVTHLKRWRLMEMIGTDLWRRAVPWNELMFRERQPVNDLNVRVRDRFSVVLAFLALGALVAAWWSPVWLAAAAFLIAVTVGVNAPFFKLLQRRKGTFFALRAVPLYWLYLLVCGVGFGIGLARHLLSPRR